MHWHMAHLHPLDGLQPVKHCSFCVACATHNRCGLAHLDLLCRRVVEGVFDLQHGSKQLSAMPAVGRLPGCLAWPDQAEQSADAAVTHREGLADGGHPAQPAAGICLATVGHLHELANLQYKHAAQRQHGGNMMKLLVPSRSGRTPRHWGRGGTRIAVACEAAVCLCLLSHWPGRRTRCKLRATPSTAVHPYSSPAGAPPPGRNQQAGRTGRCALRSPPLSPRCRTRQCTQLL